MNFSKSFLDELRSRISLGDLIGEKVTWDEKKSRRSVGDLWAPCPFHEEKTASFHVDTSKGFYYCFGCHAKGDCFTFLRDYENLSFPDTVTYLAERVGVTVPKSDRLQTEADKTRQILYEIMATASEFFTKQLNTRQAYNCQKYIETRNISTQSMEQFEIGFAPKGYQELYHHLKEKGFNANLIRKSGLCIESESDHSVFDRFRNRLIFPIKDERERIIAFGGRSLDANPRAKYLNSPETLLFSKGRVVYNFSSVRKTRVQKSSLIVVEGYMDVIALFQAGFPNAVAPLGTAITSSQLKLLWKLDQEPTILLDGDEAGQKAANSILSLAIPDIEPEKSLRFGILPKNQDPDDYINSEGPEALERVIETALPLVKMLWSTLTANTIFDSPEKKAALELNIKQEVGKIKNNQLRFFYLKEIETMLNDFFKPLTSHKNIGSNHKFRSQALGSLIKNSKPLAATKRSALGSGTNNVDIELRLKEGAILLGALNHPAAAYALETELSRIPFKFSDLRAIRDAILNEIPIKTDTSILQFQETVNERINFDAKAALHKIPYLVLHKYLEQNATELQAKKTILDTIVRHKSLTNFKNEIQRAKKAISDDSNEDLTSRIQRANKSLRQSLKGTEPTVINSDEIAKESSKLLNAMIKEKIWLKKK